MSAAKVIMSVQWDKMNNRENGISSFLKEVVAEVASKELREDKNSREQALEQFRDWIAKTQDIHNCRTDNSFLLRFLRVKKFSVPMAEQMLLKYLNLRETFPHLFHNLDVLCPSVNGLITDGYIFVSPYRDSSGRRVIIYNTQKLDPYKYTSVDMNKAHMVTYETLLEDEECQVLGFTHIADVGHMSASHVTLWSPNEFATVIKWGEQSIPMRHKAIHWLGLPSALCWLQDFVMGRFSPKINSRFMNHKTVEDLHKTIDPKILPKEYGGVMPMKDMIELWKQEMLAKRDAVLALDKIQLLSDKNIVGRHNNNNNNAITSSLKTGITSLPGSFRRLEVD